MSGENDNNNIWLIWPLVIGAIILVAFSNGHFPGLSMKAVEAGDIATTFGGLVFIALIIERVVEVYVQPRTEARMMPSQKEVAKVQARVTALTGTIKAADPTMPAAFSETAAELEQATTDLAAAEEKRAGEAREQRLETIQLATPITIAISLLVALSGVRALAGFIETEMLGPQRMVFDCIDVIFTAGLLAGGADGIHKVLDSFITTMDKMKQKAEGTS